MSKFWVLFICALVCLMTFIVHVRGNAAEAMARTRIEEYCIKNGIPIAEMDGPIISKRHVYEWIFDYASKTPPKHEVRLYIDVFGAVEEHRLIESP